MLPAQKRPCGSHLPSFMRRSSRSAITGATISKPPPFASSRPKPVCTATTQPPPRRGAKQPMCWPTSVTVCRPLRGS
jgi:hypothetical protein